MLRRRPPPENIGTEHVREPPRHAILASTAGDAVAENPQVGWPPSGYKSDAGLREVVPSRTASLHLSGTQLSHLIDTLTYLSTPHSFIIMRGSFFNFVLLAATLASAYALPAPRGGADGGNADGGEGGVAIGGELPYHPRHILPSAWLRRHFSGSANGGDARGGNGSMVLQWAAAQPTAMALSASIVALLSVALRTVATLLAAKMASRFDS